MDLILEAVVEDMDVKKKLLGDLAQRSGIQTILATNTSALSVTEMASSVPNPGRVIGLHFFNPAHVMPLVEVIVHDKTAPEVTASAMRFVQSIGKVPVLVRDRPGFVVNRILMPYMLEAVRLATLMRDPWELDEAMVEFGMPMGPLRLLDEVGFDIALHVEKTVRDAFGDRLPKSDLLLKMEAKGMLGRKNGKGFYTDHNKKGRPQPNMEVVPLLTPKESPLFANHQEMAEHLHSFMQKEAAVCLQEGVAASAQDIELAMMLGAGHPPFRDLFPETSNNSPPVSHETHA
jgi:3-hydroxyacyl-CoA dehydrogenase / enoyl-CoA hydratase / 3-hydroxybutyryl-CoA epimerase